MIPQNFRSHMTENFYFGVRILYEKIFKRKQRSLNFSFYCFNYYYCIYIICILSS